MYFSRKPNVSYFKVFGCKCFVLNTKDNLGKFDPKSYEAIFVGYSSTSKAYRVFNRSSLTIEESIHVKFEESNLFVKNVVEIDALHEGLEKVTLEDTPTMGDKPKDDEGSEAKIQEAQGNEDQTNGEEPTQQLPKDWRYNPHHPKDLVIGDVSKGVTTRSKLHDYCGHYAFISHVEPKNVLEAEADSYWLLAMQEELNQFERNQVWHLVPKPHDRPTIGTKWIFKNKLDESGNVIRNKARLVAQGYTLKSKVSILKKPLHP